MNLLAITKLLKNKSNFKLSLIIYSRPRTKELDIDNCKQNYMSQNHSLKINRVILWISSQSNVNTTSNWANRMPMAQEEAGL